jgi:hypothetical protein
MECDVEQKIYLSTLGDVPFRIRFAHQGRMHSLGKLFSLFGDFLLLIPRQRRKNVVLGTNENRYSGLSQSSRSDPLYLVKASGLPIPLFDTVQCSFPRKIEHEKNSYCIIRYER